jgi:ferredoxin-NADP reductase
VSAAFKHYSVQVLNRRWLSPRSFELTLERPAHFTFKAGQRICVYSRELSRQYSLASGPQDPALTLCIRRIEDGRMSGRLSAIQPGGVIDFGGPTGYFTYQPTSSLPVFVATGTGIAPFRAILRSGLRRFFLLHGVPDPEELYYRKEMQTLPGSYVPCVAGAASAHTGAIYPGRVTDYVREKLPDGSYDFYLCGGRNMVRDVMGLVDLRFPQARIFTELFY